MTFANLREQILEDFDEVQDRGQERVQYRADDPVKGRTGLSDCWTSRQTQKGIQYNQESAEISKLRARNRFRIIPLAPFHRPWMMKRSTWTVEQEELVISMYLQEASWEEIAEATGHTPGSCSQKFSWLKLERNLYIPNIKLRQGDHRSRVRVIPWTRFEEDILLERLNGEPWPSILQRLKGRTYGSCSARLRDLKQKGLIQARQTA